MLTDHVIDGVAEQPRQMAVGIQNLPRTRERDRSFLHVFDQRTKRLIRTFQMKDLRSVRAVHHHRVDVTGRDRVEGGARLVEQRRGMLCGVPLAFRHRVSPHCDCMSSAMSARSAFERSPMMRFIGSGILRTNVGTARI